MNYQIVAFYIKKNDLKLIERISINHTNFYFRLEDQLLCQHTEKFNKVYDFKKFKRCNIRLNESEFNFYRPKFKDYTLMNDQQYDSYIKNLSKSENDQFNRLLEQHKDKCSICRTKNEPTKLIRKRKKLNEDEKQQLAYDIGKGKSYKKLCKEWNLSKKTIRIFKRNLKNRISNKKKVKLSKSTVLT